MIVGRSFGLCRSFSSSLNIGGIFNAVSCIDEPGVLSIMRSTGEHFHCQVRALRWETRIWPFWLGSIELLRATAGCPYHGDLSQFLYNLVMDAQRMRTLVLRSALGGDLWERNWNPSCMGTLTGVPSDSGFSRPSLWFVSCG